MDFGFGGFSGARRTGTGDRIYRQRKPVGNGAVRILLSLLATAVAGALYFYFALPALNIHSGDLYRFLFWMCVVFILSMVWSAGFRGSAQDTLRYVKKALPVPLILIGVILAVAVVGGLAGATVFRADAYSRLLRAQEGDFSGEVTEISFDQIPMLDEVSANALAIRKLGELSDLVSQFEVDSESCQINYKGTPTRVAFLNYGDFFKWLNNQKRGIPAYLSIDMVTQEVTVRRLEDGIRYSPSEYFFRNIDRYLRYRYPTLIFDDTNFEIDENGTPYWVATVMKKTIGLFGGTDVAGAVLVDARTGECTYYGIEDIPSWVDRVCPAALLIRQYDYYGRFHNGFWNAYFGQRECTVTTDGYNYIALDDDVWMYTGITSVGGDESNVGFILVNQRTKEARYYAVAGAEEFSAMSSAQGAVQQYSYNATFPLLLNISGQPTYFMALKDTSNLVKMYAMVNVQQYQIVAIGSTVAECSEKYETAMIRQNVIGKEDARDTAGGEVTGRIEEIRSACMDGDTYYFFLIDDVYYSICAKDYPIAVIMNEGDKVTVTYAGGEGPIREGTGIAVK